MAGVSEYNKKHKRHSYNNGLKGNYTPLKTINESDFFDYIDRLIGGKGKLMDRTKAIMDKQVSEGDLFILMLVENGNMTYREVGDLLQMSHGNVAFRYQRAAKRLAAQVNNNEAAN